ncbi:MAG: hypothetical protein LBJ31_07370 [Treponema sp.]|nr:hypothetical protein [Treponema sp.]
MDFELAFENIKKFSDQIKLQECELFRNEATTRIQLIDKMLIDCLGWDRQYIETEQYFQDEYTDYELGIPQKRLVIEAKREGTYFELPAGFKKEKCALRTICNLSTEFNDAIAQVTKYCNTRGIPIAVVTNGHQYIFFICNRQDGIAPSDGQCLVFPSIDNILSNFNLFWDVLSCAGVNNNKIYDILKGKYIIPAPDKLSQKIVNYPGNKNRNPIAAELQILGGLFLEDIGRIPDSEEEFIKDTYCTSGALSQYSLVSKEILMSRYTKFLKGESSENIESITQKHGLNENFKRDLLTAGITRRPIILIGDVGVGKTMFIKHFIYVEAKNELANEIVMYLDFGTKPAFFMELDKYVIDEIIQQLLNKYNIDIYEKNLVRGIYNLEIERFRRGIYSDYLESDAGKYKEKEIVFLEELIKDSEKHLLKSLNHIVKGRNKQIVIFFDNVDQRPFDFQEKVFLISQSLAETWPVISFISLRPDTFAKSKAKGVLAAYQPRVFTIDPPRVDKVIKKRLDYALNKLKSMGIISNAHSAIRFDLNKLEKYIEMLIQTLEKSTDVIEFIDNMSNGNLRKVIEFIGIFVGSAHVDSTKILDIIDREGSYHLPIHEFLRALIYKDNEYYNPDDSVFINVFDISNNNPKEHFIVLILISIIYKMGKKNLDEGYVEKSEIYRILQKLGYKENEIQNALSLCLEKSLIASPNYDTPASSNYIRILPAGAYMLLKLSCMFTYIDSIIVDTPIINSEFRGNIHNALTIDDRLIRAEIFLNYLKQSWNGLCNDYLDWEDYSQESFRQIEDIKFRIQRRQQGFHEKI